MIPTPDYDACLDCGRRLKTPTSRRRGRGPLCNARYLAAHPFLRIHRDPPRHGRLPGFDMDGEAALFDAQTMIPAAPAATDTTSNEENP